jgi:hypothetical protein
LALLGRHFLEDGVGITPTATNKIALRLRRRATARFMLDVSANQKAIPLPPNHEVRLKWQRGCTAYNSYVPLFTDEQESQPVFTKHVEARKYFLENYSGQMFWPNVLAK